ncbi:DUF190 domain-containing protein [Methermicoccus shengliensis]|uniref:DUF190 domain-containing protein n=1 Tax=Methermicoccus shengliensis TaxID=660064 RepID=A0A832RXI6_9EURY|nr:DUF190 domain-containing protein [Methermicoccus shengliensis]KUK04921.1 MAG: hypothetical protein XD46_0452 [Euryarchaeota archaeon 55_53]KUK30449.1 MAG: hypothetical protein XD62_0520 [Methanosarcinales archeaon 56_1174]MDI3488648.1 uncharacterized protein [Methanosarcinales archaeon]MDN5295297.1 uncharacterized protein [Methanosarcinales archaeon]HIH69614.1 DUF190 domain-containing protein [Methermicoccus shengliensis]
MKKESDAIMLRIFVGDSDKYEGKPLYKYLVEMFKKEGIAGATVLRGFLGYGKTSCLHTASILRLSADLPIVIEVIDSEDKIEKIKVKLGEIVKGGLITQERVKVILYEGDSEE